MNNISRVFEVTYSHFSISGFLMGFRDFRVFVFGYRAQNENPETTENHYFWVIMMKCMWIWWVSKMILAKTNSINLERSEALKRQIPATWSAMQLNHFDFWVWCHLNIFQVSWSYILILQYYGVFVKFPWLLSFCFWVYGSKRKPRNHGKFVFFSFYFSGHIKLIFVYIFPYF